jgi:hypothetical protein
MKKFGFIFIGILAILTLSSNLVSADCVEDCQSTFATCMRYCSDTKCQLSCNHGLNGCLKRCEKQSDNSTHNLQRMAGALPE